MESGEKNDESMKVTAETEVPIVEKNEIEDDQQKSLNELADSIDDVPDDFFDDFANQDFMDGLDIVDAWDDNEKNKLNNELKLAKEREANAKDKIDQKATHDDKNKQKLLEKTSKLERKREQKNVIHIDKHRASKEDRLTSPSKEKHRKSPSRDKYKQSPFKYKREISSSKENRDKLKSRERRDELKSPLKKSNEKEMRRDPEKTKRDLEKDRQNYVKKREQKLISKVVETGLVPPGMETEISLRELEAKEDSHKVEKNKSKHRRESRSEEKSKIRKKPSRSSDRHRHSPIFRSRSRERSFDRKRMRRERSREQCRRLSRDRIPEIRKRSRSPVRERWPKLRNSSPEKKHKPTEEKMSFIEELKIKLSGHPSNNHSPVDFNIGSHTNAHPILHQIQPNYMPVDYHPNLVQQPTQFYPPQNCQYDQNFFIGEQQQIPMNGPPQMVGPPQIIGPPGPILPLPPHGLQQPMGNFTHTFVPVTPVPAPTPFIQQHGVSSAGLDGVAKLMEQIKATTNMKINEIKNNDKMNIENKISSPGFQFKNEVCSSNPDALQKKISVLSRCQDILTELSGEKKLGGKLKVTKRSLNKADTQSTNMSPLLKNLPVSFYFTNASLEKPSYVNILNRALIKAGIYSERPKMDEVVEEIVPPPPPIINESPVPFSEQHKQYKPEVLKKMCQTDPIKCENCEKRNNKKYVSVGIQCGESERFNVGVQINESDIINSKIGNNQSLAHLTPAQLLGRNDTTTAKVKNFENVYGSGGNIGRPQFQDYRSPYQDFIGERRAYNEPDHIRRMEYEYQNNLQGSARDARFFPHRY